MVGNVSEWVADWGDSAADCTDWLTGTGFSDGDLSCFGGPGGAGFLSLPGAVYRGGSWSDGKGAGPLAAQSDLSPFSILGFRCAR
jgi:formylglycine-generating enzyme required for sulfatase activity